MSQTERLYKLKSLLDAGQCLSKARLLAELAQDFDIRPAPDQQRAQSGAAGGGGVGHASVPSISETVRVMLGRSVEIDLGCGGTLLTAITLPLVPTGRLHHVILSQLADFLVKGTVGRAPAPRIIRV